MPPPTLTEELASLETAVSNKLFHGYGPRPIPDDLDQRLGQFVATYLSSSLDEQALLKCLPRETADVLLAFAERQAALAVRMKSHHTLTQSLVALGLAAEINNDESQSMSVFPLPWHAAKQLAAEPKIAFTQASSLLPQIGRLALLSFCQRTPEDQTLSCMGYVAGSEDGGFRYVRTW